MGPLRVLQRPGRQPMGCAGGPLVLRLGGRPDGPEQAVFFAVYPRGEEQDALWAGVVAVAEPQAPQAVDYDRRAVGPAQSAVEVAGLNLVGVDSAVTEVAHEQVSAEPTEAFRGDG